MKKEDKSRIIENIESTIQSYSHLYLADTAGLNAEETSNLRRTCNKQNIKLLIVKNTLLKRAFDNLDADYSELYDVLKGQTSLFLSDTGNAPAKLIKNFSRKNKKKKPLLKAAYVEESFYIGEEFLDTLVSIKSKDELIGEIIGLLQSPIKNVMSALQSGGTTIHGVLETLSERNN